MINQLLNTFFQERNSNGFEIYNEADFQHELAIAHNRTWKYYIIELQIKLKPKVILQSFIYYKKLIILNLYS